MLPLALMFAALDLLGQSMPIFSSEKWGTFGEWALALVTPIAVFATVDLWQRDRIAQKGAATEAARDEQLKKARKAESLLRGLRVMQGQGVGGAICYLQNDSDLSIVVTRTDALGTLADPLVVKSGSGCPIPGAPVNDRLLVETSEGEFSVTQLGVKCLTQ